MRDHSEMVFDKGYLLPEDNFINDNEFLGSVVQRYLPNRKYRRNAGSDADTEQSRVQSVLFEYGESYAATADSGDRSTHFDGRQSSSEVQTLHARTPLMHSSHALLSCTPPTHSSHALLSYIASLYAPPLLHTGGEGQESSGGSDGRRGLQGG
jgi:hypothetical protein